jgi:hypothetical protein
MSIQRAVMSGTILNAVQVRNMFVADVTEVGGDTYPVLWDTYIDMLYSEFANLVGTSADFTSYEIQRRNAGQWESLLVSPYTFTPIGTGDQTPNQVALTLIGKAQGVRKLGRKFFSGLDITGMSGNSLTVGGIAVAVLMLTYYVSPVIGIGGGTLVPGILDKTETFHPFVGGVVSSFLGTMRRRKPGVGI